MVLLNSKMLYAATGRNVYLPVRLPMLVGFEKRQCSHLIYMGAIVALGYISKKIIQVVLECWRCFYYTELVSVHYKRKRLFLVFKEG